jgi:anti-anti-sigma factor
VQVHTSIADVSTSEVGSATVAVVEGAVDLATIAAFHGALTQVLRQHPATVVIVDLDGVTVLDDAGLGVLLGAAAAARDAGGDIEVVCTRPSLRERLAHTRLDRAITVRSSIAAR